MKFNTRTALLAGLLTLGASHAFGAVIDVVFYDNRFGTLDDSTGSFHQLSTLPISASAGIASMNGLLYVEDMGTKVFTVDPVTGAYALVGNTGLNITAGAFAGGSNGLFEVDYASNLYQINAATGAGTLVGATGIVANNGHYDTSLSAYGSLLYYTAGLGGHNDELYVIDTNTGHATDLGSTGLASIAGSAIVDGQLELYQYGQSTNYAWLAPVGSVNFTRGAHLSTTILDGGALYTALTAVTGNQTAAVPEPSSGLMLTGGLLAFIAIHGRRRQFRKQKQIA